MKNFKKEKIKLLLYSLVIITSAMNPPYFYLNWILGLLLIILNAFILLYKGKLNVCSVKLFILSTMWLVGPVLSAFLGRNISVADNFKYIILYLYHIILSILFLNLIIKGNKVEISKTLYLVNVLWLLMSFISLYFQVYRPSTTSIEFSGILSNRNEFAIYTTIFSSYLMFYRKDYENKFGINILLGLSFVVVISTGSIKGVAGWIFIYIISLRKNKVTIKETLGYLILLMFIPVLINYLIISEHIIIERLSRFLLVSKDKQSLRVNESAFLRVYYAKEGLKVFYENPLVGIGIKNSKYFLISPLKKFQGFTIGTYSHNGYIEMLLNGGILSFLLYYGLLFRSFIVLLSRYRLEKNNKNKYVLSLLLYRFLIDFGSVSTENILLNVIFIFILYESFLSKSSKENPIFKN